MNCSIAPRCGPLARSVSARNSACPPICLAAQRPLVRRSVVVRANNGTTENEYNATTRGSGVAIDGKSTNAPIAWQQLVDALEASNVKIISMEDAIAAHASGNPVVDIRPASEFGKICIVGTYNVPFFRPIEGWSGMQTIRRVGFALFGVLNGTEVNPDFVEMMDLTFEDKETEIVMMCSLGASMEADTEGKYPQTRSMIAAFELVKAGYKNLKLVQGGFNGLAKSGEVPLCKPETDE